MERKPAWLKVSYNQGAVDEIAQLMRELNLNTVCREADCPNIGECYRKHTATFLIMGSHCTRNCRFCAIEHGRPEPLDSGEPRRLAEAAAELGLEYVVVTSVTRDDLPDGGAAHFAATIEALRGRLPEAQVEVLTPDFQGRQDCLDTVLAASPDVFNHNVETVRRLEAPVRPQAGYDRSLGVLRAAAGRVLTKSGLMVGLGETDDEVQEALEDLRHHGVRLVTIGQYLQPTPRSWPVAEYLPPARFARFAAFGRRLGFDEVLAGPLVRSSFGAAELARAVAADGLPAGTDRGSER